METLKQFFKELVVVETATILAGPSVGMFLAELGATVIKVENLRAGGDTTRLWKLPSEAENPSTVSAYFSSINWGKQSLGLDVSKPEGLGVLQDLLQSADIFLHNFKTADMHKFGLTFPDIHALNSKLIYARVTAYGEDDPRPGFDALLQAGTGFTAINGQADGAPTKMPVALIDVLLAHQMKQAILLALMERNLSGLGTEISISLFQSGVAALVNQATNYLVADTVPQRKGSDHPNISPYGTIFKTADNREIVLAVGSNKQFAQLVEALGKPELAADERFKTNGVRVVNNDVLKGILGEEIGRFNRDTLLTELYARQVPAGPLHTMDEVFAQPSAKGMILNGERLDASPIQGVRGIAFPTTAINGTETLSAPPEFNQHVGDVLRSRLGYSEDEIAVLSESGAVHL